jgi:hypothetical protein
MDSRRYVECCDFYAVRAMPYIQYALQKFKFLKRISYDEKNKNGPGSLMVA